MIISFKNINGGGGSGYTLPVATSEVLGGVKIGSGVTVDSAGTISVTGTDVANYAMALKSIAEIDGDNLKVVNESGYLYSVDDFKNTDTDIFVKVKYDYDYIYINFEIDKQTEDDIVEIGNDDFSFTISIDSEGNLLYINENDEEVYYDSATTEYQYGDFTFQWYNDGKYISFPQQATQIESEPLTDNFEIWRCVSQELYIANEDELGLVKIGEGIDLAEDGTISVSGGGIEVVTELPASGTDGQMVMLVKSYEGSEEIVIRGTDTMDTAVTFTAKSVTEQTKLWRYSYYNDSVGVSANTDGTLSIYSDYFNTGATISGDTSFVLDGRDGGGGENEITVTKVAEGEWIFANESPVERWEVYTDVIPPATEYKLYKWSDEETPSIDAVISNDGFMIEIFYDEIPTYTESAFTVVKVSIMEEAPKVEVEYRNGIFYNMEDQNTPLIADGQIHTGPWGNTLYLISDGYIKLISNNGVIKIVDTDIWNGQMNATGWTEYGRKGVVYNGKNCYLDFPVKFNGNSPIYNNTNIYVPTSIGNNGQILKTNGEGVYWGDLVIPKTEIYQSLPYGGNEGDLVLTNSEYSPTTASTFISKNSTSESDKNNFSNNDELWWYDGGNNYIYFGNASAYTNTMDTFLYRIAMRTNENSDWKTSELAYINVVKAGNAYEIFMDNFNYYDSGGTPVPYTFTMTLSSTGTTSGNTPYLPLWRHWDGGYGYKFHFEIDQDNNLKMWMKNSSADSDQQDPDYVQGQNYGDVPVKCMDHTETFYDYITFDQDDTHLSIYKGGVWYELGYLTRQGV